MLGVIAAADGDFFGDFVAALWRLARFLSGEFPAAEAELGVLDRVWDVDVEQADRGSGFELLREEFDKISFFKFYHRLIIPHARGRFCCGNYNVRRLAAQG